MAAAAEATASPSRKYHDTNAAYKLPNDSPEQQRLEGQAIALEQLMGEIFQAPLKNPRRILEIGCGTGRCTVQLAKKFPDAEVIGLDLSPVPSLHDRPDNVKFVQGDFIALADSNDDRFQPGSFDYIFSRLLIFGMTDWVGYFKRVDKLLAPGGWIEAHEVDIATRDIDDNIIDGDDAALNSVRNLAIHSGFDVRAGGHLKSYMLEAGLSDAHERKFLWPIVPWPGKPETDGIQKMVAALPRDFKPAWNKFNSDGFYTQKELEGMSAGFEAAHSPAARQVGDHYNFVVVYSRKLEG